MLLNISEILDDDLFVEPTEIGITTHGFDGDGNPTESVAWQTVSANVQPVGDDQLQRLDPAERYKQNRQLFTNQIEIRIGDYFKEFSELYRCISDQDFKKHGYSDVIGIRYNGVEATEDDGFTPPFAGAIKPFGFAGIEFGGNYGFGEGEFIDK